MDHLEHAGTLGRRTASAINRRYYVLHLTWTRVRTSLARLLSGVAEA